MADPMQSAHNVPGTTKTPPPFGRLLKRLRRLAELTQATLAERAGYSTTYIGMLERGERLPASATIDALAGALGAVGGALATLHAAAQEADGQRQLPTGLSTRSLLAGRSAEIALLEQHLAGAGPPVLLLAGEPGIGKTRLLDEAAQRGSALGWMVLHSGCQRLSGESDSYAPILAALERHVLRQRRTTLRTQLQGCSWLARLLPDVMQAASAPFPVWTLPPQRERQLVFLAVARFLRNIAGPAGTLLVLDDLHWAGPDALELLVMLARASTEAGPSIRIIGAYRQSGFQGDALLSIVLADLAQAHLVSRQVVPPLDPGDARRLLEMLIPDLHALTPDKQDQLLRRTGGIPFFIMSYAQSIASDDGQDLPWNLVQSVRRRIELLPAAAQEMLQAAALMGRTVRRTLLIAVLALPDAMLLEAVESACDARLLEEHGDGYRFAHDVIQEVVEADLSGVRRVLLHRRIAETLERMQGDAAAEALAYYFEQADLPERALPYLEQAGDRAFERLAYGMAAEHYRTLAERLDRMGRALEAANAREKSGIALTVMGHSTAAIAALEAAAVTYSQLHDLTSLGHLLARIGHAHMRRGTADEGIVLLGESLPLLTPYGASSGIAAIYATLAELFFVSGHYAEQVEVATKAAEVARQIGDDRALAIAEGRHGVALLLLGRLAEAVPILERTVRLAGAVGELDSLCRALSNLGVVHFIRGEFSCAKPYRERALAVARRQGDPFSIIRTLANRGEGAIYSGDWQQARADLTEALALIEQTEQTGAAAYPLLDLALLSLVEGQWSQIDHYVDAATRLAEQSGDLQVLRWAATVLAERDIRQGEPARAAARLIPLRDRPGMEETDVTYLLPTLAWALLETGDLPGARELAGPTVERARAQHHQVMLVDALRVQALVANYMGEWRNARSSLEEALALARAMPYPYAEARLLHLSSVIGGFQETAITRAHADALARMHLGTALAEYERLGAQADASLARHDLAALPYTRRLLDVGLVITAQQWTRVGATLPKPGRLGRPRADDQRTCSAILYVLHSGCSWGKLPIEFGDAATAHRRFQQLRKGGIWDGIAAILKNDGR